MVRAQRRNDEGMALLVAMIFLILMGLLATWATSRVMNNTRSVDKYVDFQNTFEGLESAFDQAKVELITPGEDGQVGVDPTYDFTQGTPTWGDPLVTPQQLTMQPEIQYFAYTFDWATDGVDNNGDGQVDIGPETLGYHSTYAFARAARNGNVSATRSGEQIIQLVNVNIWQNAIFAGNGQAGNLINGNVSIHGSVHLLGGNLGAGGVAIAALDLSGTSLIHNNYEGLSADLRGRVPGLPTTTFNGEVVDTLWASLRVKNGLVGMSGASEVGEADQTGNSFKETMDGVYVNDGWTGTDIDANGDPQSVYSDNGWDELYDLGDAVPFPTFDDDGGRDHLAYYLQTSSDPNSGLHSIYDGDLTIEPGAGSFYWDATTMQPGDQVVGGSPGDGNMPQAGDLDPDHFYVWFDDDTDTLLINGRVPVDGNINLLAGNGASNKLINYEGKGSLLAYSGENAGGDVEISASLKTDDFPANLLGVQAENNMSIGTSAQIEIMGGFYSQNEVSTDKQTTIMGTIVGDYFNMGTNVPDIYQVPELSNAWLQNMRMIGSDPVLFPVPISWRELSIL